MEEHRLLGEEDVENDAAGTIPVNLLPEMNECFRLFPKRPVMNALVQLFFQNVNWIYEMVHPAPFLRRYEKWWQSAPGSTNKSLHFSILILRICSYSAQFFPTSTSETGADGGTELLGVPVDKIRGHCHELASRLQRLCEQLSGPKSLIWVHQLFYTACYEKNEGNLRSAWYILGAAIRVAQDLGLHVENTRMGNRSMNDEEYDMGRRAFWNLYIWDRFLALILDRAPCIVDSHCSTDLPKSRFSSAALDAAAPDIFTERMLQAKLSKLCSSLDLGTHYDPVIAEESYEKLSHSFISQLPRAFHIYAPDTQWDIKLPNLCRQRQTLRIAIFVSLCQIFRPLLRLSVDQVNELLPYKRDLLVRHRRKLVLSAIQVLSSVKELQHLMGGGPQRFFMLSFCTFEPAMLICLHLLTLNGSEQAQTQAQDRSKSEQRLFVRKSVDLSIDSDEMSPQTCRQHIEQALRVLLSLQHVSTMAKVGARKLEQVLARLDATSATSCSPPAAILIVPDEVNADDWLGLEMQRLSDTDEGYGVSDGVHDDRHVEDEPWGARAFSQWIAEEDSVYGVL